MNFAIGSEERAFAESVRHVMSGARASDWRPGAALDDHDAELAARLDDIGLGDTADAGHGFLVAAGVELGRALAPLSIVDAVALRTAEMDPNHAALAAGGIARYAANRQVALDLRAEGAFAVPLDGARLEPALDSQGFVRLTRRGEPTIFPSLDTWARLHIAYLAGVADGALEIAVKHARDRQQFGKPLLHLAPVQQMLADAATSAQGLHLLAWEQAETPWPALVYAGEATSRVCEAAHQVHGAIGYTLEVKLHCFSRRAHASRMFTRAVAHAARTPSAVA